MLSSIVGEELLDPLLQLPSSSFFFSLNSFSFLPSLSSSSYVLHVLLLFVKVKYITVHNYVVDKYIQSSTAGEDQEDTMLLPCAYR